jgi:DNA-binding XRE family transcriptional regulator
LPTHTPTLKNQKSCFFQRFLERKKDNEKKINMKLGKHLRKKRYEKKMSQQEIADFINVSQKTYSNFESDKSLPSILQLVNLSELLEFNFLELIKQLKK